ncbi:MAG: anti-sigma factor, partial [Gemmatimonadota bacterium]
MTEANGHVQELLDRYRTGELDPADHGRVESHLEGCEGCRSALAAMEAFATTVERAYAAETTARATKREPDWGRLRASIVGRTSAREPGLRRSWLARHVPQTAALVVALVAVGVLWQQGIRAPGDADRGLRSERPAGSRADRAGGRSGGLAVEAEGEGKERPGLEDRVAGAAAPEGGEVAPSEVSPDEVDAVQQGRVAAREAAPAAEAIGQDDMMAKAGAREGNTVSGFRLEARADSA